MSAAPAAVTTASVAPAIITIFITVLFPSRLEETRQSPAARSPQTRRQHECRNTSTVRQVGHVRRIGLQYGRYETCRNLDPCWVDGAIAERRYRANPSEGDAKAILTTGLRCSAKGQKRPRGNVRFWRKRTLGGKLRSARLSSNG